MRKLRKIYNEWMDSHPNIGGTGRYLLTYNSKKIKRIKAPNFLGKFFVFPNGRIFKRLWKNSDIYQEAMYRIEVDARKTRSGGIRTPYPSVRVKLKGRYYSVSRVVAMVYVRNPKPKEYNVVMHLDNDKLNNNYTNLQWGNQSQNICQARDEGRLPTLFVSGPKNPSYGKRRSPLSIEEEKQIVKEVLSGKFTKISIARKHGLCRSNINWILKRNGCYGK